MTPHTTSLEVAKQLAAVCREKGIEMPESDEYWAEYRNRSVDSQKDWHWVVTDSLYEGDYYEYKNTIKTYSLGELMRMLPPNTEMIAQVDSDRIKGGAMVISPDNERVLSDTPEDAAALLLIELIKSGEITSLRMSA